MHSIRRLLASTCLALLPLSAFAAEGGDELRRVLSDVELDRLWIYDDWDTASARAKKLGKPVFALFR